MNSGLLIKKAATCLIDANQIMGSVSNVSNTIAGNNTAESNTLSSSFNPLKSKHWSITTLAIGAVVGAVVAVAAFIFKQYAVMSLGILLCSSNFIGAYFLDRFLPNEILESYLDKIAKAIADSKKAYTDLGKIKDNLTDQLGLAQHLADSTGKELTLRTDNLKVTTHKLNEVTQNLSAINSAYNQVKDRLESYEKANDRLTKENAHFAALAQDLNKHLSRVKNSNTEVASNIEKLHRETGTLSNSVKSLENIDHIAKLHGEMQEILHDNELLLKRIKDLDIADDKILATAQKTADASSRVELASDHLKDTVDGLNNITRVLTKVVQATEQWKKTHQGT